MKLSFIKSVKTLFEGLSVVFKHLFKKPVTLEYPEKKKEMNISETPTFDAWTFANIK